MININTETILFKLISLGLDESSDSHFLQSVDWKSLWTMSSQQGVLAICLDGLQLLDKKNGYLASIPMQIKMQWIASVVQQEKVYNVQWYAAKS